MSEDSVKTHPSYAHVCWNRVRSSSGVDCYMSDLKHDSFIELEVYEAETHRSLNRYRTFARGGELFKLRMSELQFAQFITTPNAGGVPCTLTRKNGQFVEACPPSDTVAQYRSEVDSSLQEMISKASVAVNQVQQMLEGKTVKKTDLRELKRQLDLTIQDMQGSMPWLVERFKEHMDSVFVDAVTSFEAHMTDRLVLQEEDSNASNSADTIKLPRSR